MRTHGKLRKKKGQIFNEGCEAHFERGKKKDHEVEFEVAHLKLQLFQKEETIENLNDEIRVWQGKTNNLEDLLEQVYRDLCE